MKRGAPRPILFPLFPLRCHEKRVIAPSRGSRLVEKRVRLAPQFLSTALASLPLVPPSLPRYSPPTNPSLPTLIARARPNRNGPPFPEGSLTWLTRESQKTVPTRITRPAPPPSSFFREPYKKNKRARALLSASRGRVGLLADRNSIFKKALPPLSW